MSDSAKLHLCYGIILLVLSFLCIASFVSFIWLAVLVDGDFVILAVVTFILTIFLGIAGGFQLFVAGTYMEEK